MNALLLAALLAAAAEPAPIFPRGSRAGIVPPPGLTARAECTCFASDDGAATIAVFEAPHEAYAQAEADGIATWKRRGMESPVREELTVDGRRAFLISGALTNEGIATHAWWLVVDAAPETVMITGTVRSDRLPSHPAAVMRTALVGARLRAPLSLAERIEALPFAIGDFGGFRPVSVIAGSALMFTEGPADVVKAVEQPVVWVALGVGAAETAERRAEIARHWARKGSTLTDLREVASVGESRDGASWHRVELVGTHPATGEAVRTVEVIRFHADGFVVATATLRDADRERLGPRVRQLAYSIARR
jgi:hypothetical protein